MSQWDGLLHFHFKEDPEKWDDDKYFKKIAQLSWIFENGKNG